MIGRKVFAYKGPDGCGYSFTTTPHCVPIDWTPDGEGRFLTEQDLETLTRRAAISGFEHSGEGWNGEYPFDCDRNRMEQDDDLRQDLDDIVNELLREVVK